MQINRQTRDRKGGHKSSVLTHSVDGDDPCIIHYTPACRSLVKKLGKKKVRRQFNRSMKHIQRELDNDYSTEEFLMDLELAEFYNDQWYDDDWRHELEAEPEEEPMDWYDPWYYYGDEEPFFNDDDLVN